MQHFRKYAKFCEATNVTYAEVHAMASDAKYALNPYDSFSQNAIMVNSV